MAHTCRSSGPPEPKRQQVLDGVYAVPQNCNAAVSLSNGTSMTGGQADKQQSACNVPEGRALKHMGTQSTHRGAPV